MLIPTEAILIADARERLCDGNFSADQAEYAVERLLNRGYLYAVKDTLFVTGPEGTPT